MLSHLQQESPYETTAVLTMTEQEALMAYQYLKEYFQDISYIDRNSSAFQKALP